LEVRERQAGGLRRRPGEGHASHVKRATVGIRVIDLAAPIVRQVDVPAGLASEDAGPETQSVLDDRPAERHACLIRRVAALRRQPLCAPIRRIAGEAGSGLDVTDRTPLRAAAEQRALRAAQDLDTLQVEQRRHRRAVLRAESAGGSLLQSRLVQIEARGGRRAALLTDAANRYGGVTRGLAPRQPQTRHRGLEIGDRLDALLIQSLLRLGGNGQRNAIDDVAAARCGNDDLLEPGGRVCAVLLRRRGLLGPRVAGRNAQCDADGHSQRQYGSRPGLHAPSQRECVPLRGLLWLSPARSRGRRLRNLRANEKWFCAMRGMAESDTSRGTAATGV